MSADIEPISEDEAKQRLGRNIRDARHRAGMRQHHVGDRLIEGGTTHASAVSTASRMERGIGWPSLGRLLHVAAVLGTTAAVLLDGVRTFRSSEDPRQWRIRSSDPISTSLTLAMLTSVRDEGSRVFAQGPGCAEVQPWRVAAIAFDANGWDALLVRQEPDPG
jgi:transcriptional regulator with XRE-family HTH domain